MDYTLEVVVVPVSDVEEARDFYVERVGFRLDHDTHPTDGIRVVQLTPPGSGCSIVLGEGLPLPPMEPGSLKGLQLVVSDLDAARAELLGRGLEVGEIQQLGPPGTIGARFVFFSDPDGNFWAVQEIREEHRAGASSAP